MTITYNVHATLKDPPQDSQIEERIVRSMLADRVNKSATMNTEQIGSLMEDVRDLVRLLNPDASDTAQSQEFKNTVRSVAMWINTCH